MDQRAFSSESCLHIPALGLTSVLFSYIQFFLQQPGVPYNLKVLLEHAALNNTKRSHFHITIIKLQHGNDGKSIILLKLPFLA